MLGPLDVAKTRRLESISDLRSSQCILMWMIVQFNQYVHPGPEDKIIFKNKQSSHQFALMQMSVKFNPSNPLLICKT